MLIDPGNSFTCQWLDGCQQGTGVILLVAVVLFGYLPLLGRQGARVSSMRKQGRSSKHTTGYCSS